MRESRLFMAFLWIAFLVASVVKANNLTITNLSLQINDDAAAVFQFDISWENGWRYTDINHDAAWVFFKIKREGSSAWEHAVLEADSVLNPSGYSVGSGTPLDFIVPEDKTGMFLRRAEHGAGDLASFNVRVLWNFSANGIPKTSNASALACALEMVFVDEGQFYLGCGGRTDQVSGSFTDGAWTSDSPTSFPFLVTSEDAITITNQSGCLWGTVTDERASNSIRSSGVLSNDFPKGYAAFYCMKYDITQGQYRDFLNSLTREQQNSRTESQLPGYFAMTGRETLYWRHGIRCPAAIPDEPDPIVFGCDGNANGIFDEEDDAEDRACHYVSWADLAAYMDWSALRPMTELEYEKACRGPLYPVPEEYAWGSATIFCLTSEADDGTGYSTVGAPANANVFYSATDFVGPYRVGLFARADSTRELSGATYWGAMDMSGNVHERVVSASTGRYFTGAHGDGVLAADGNADVVGWPGSDGYGSGYRAVVQQGISVAGLCISSRSIANWSTITRISIDRAPAGNSAGQKNGGRGVRTAPVGIGP